MSIIKNTFDDIVFTYDSSTNSLSVKTDKITLSLPYSSVQEFIHQTESKSTKKGVVGQYLIDAVEFEADDYLRLRKIDPDYKVEDLLEMLAPYSEFFSVDTDSIKKDWDSILAFSFEDILRKFALNAQQMIVATKIWHEHNQTKSLK